MKWAVLIAVAGALTLPGTATAQQNPKLLASVGPGFTITLTLADGYGEAVSQVAPGTYDIVVTDRAEVHNFHLTGPGVDQRTEVEFVGSVTWTVTLREGTYTYLCDPHSTQMRGTLTVGQPAAPAPAPAAPAKPGRLNASVGPGFTISLKTLAGRVVRSVKAGLYTIVVRDRAAIHNFHLTGRGLNRKTGVPFVGTATWQVRFVKGQTYRFVCDPHKQTMKGSFRAN